MPDEYSFHTEEIQLRSSRDIPISEIEEYVDAFYLNSYNTHREQNDYTAEINPINFLLNVEDVYYTDYWGVPAYVFGTNSKFNDHNKWGHNQIVVKKEGPSDYVISSLFYLADSVYYLDKGILPDLGTFNGNVLEYSTEDYVVNLYRVEQGTVVDSDPGILGKKIRCPRFDRSFWKKLGDWIGGIFDGWGSGGGSGGGSGSGGGFGSGSGSGGGFGGGSGSGYGPGGGSGGGSGPGGTQNGSGYYHIRITYIVNTLANNIGYYSYQSLMNIFSSASEECIENVYLSMQVFNAMDASPADKMRLTCALRNMANGESECLGYNTDQSVLEGISASNLTWAMSFGDACTMNTPYTYYSNPVCDLVGQGYSSEEINSILQGYRNYLDLGDPDEGAVQLGFEHDVDACQVIEFNNILMDGYNPDIIECLSGSDPLLCKECVDAVKDFNTTYDLNLTDEEMDDIRNSVSTCEGSAFEEEVWENLAIIYSDAVTETIADAENSGFFDRTLECWSFTFIPESSNDGQVACVSNLYLSKNFEGAYSITDPFCGHFTLPATRYNGQVISAGQAADCAAWASNAAAAVVGIAFKERNYQMNDEAMIILFRNTFKIKMALTTCGYGTVTDCENAVCPTNPKPAQWNEGFFEWLDEEIFGCN